MDLTYRILDRVQKLLAFGGLDPAAYARLERIEAYLFERLDRDEGR